MELDDLPNEMTSHILSFLNRTKCPYVPQLVNYLCVCKKWKRLMLSSCGGRLSFPYNDSKFFPTVAMWMMLWVDAEKEKKMKVWMTRKMFLFMRLNKKYILEHPTFLDACVSKMTYMYVYESDVFDLKELYQICVDIFGAGRFVRHRDKWRKKKNLSELGIPG